MTTNPIPFRVENHLGGESGVEPTGGATIVTLDMCADGEHHDLGSSITTEVYSEVTCSKCGRHLATSPREEEDVLLHKLPIPWHRHPGGPECGWEPDHGSENGPIEPDDKCYDGGFHQIWNNQCQRCLRHLADEPTPGLNRPKLPPLAVG